jgi:hypothetical protein
MQNVPVEGVRQTLTRRSTVRSYRMLVERGERELAMLPDGDGPGSSTRRGVALRVLQIVEQTRKLPVVSGLDKDHRSQQQLKPYEDRLGVIEARARRVVAEGDKAD